MNEAPPFKVGDRVTSDWYGPNDKVVRTITICGPNDSMSSKFAVATDGGPLCPTCGKPACLPIPDPGWPYPAVDSFWVKKVEGEST